MINRLAGRENTMLPCLIALLVSTCGPATLPSKPAPVGDSEFIDAQVSYIETSSGIKPKQPPKKVPMPEVEASFDFTFPNVKKKTLSNGMRVFHVLHSRLPLVSIDIVFRAGSGHDPDGMAGLAVFVGEMLKGGTLSRSSKEIAEDFGMLGTSLNVWTDYDTTVLNVTCLKEHFDTVMELLSDIVLNPTFPEEEIEILKTREFGRLKLEKSDPGWLAKKEFAARIYGSHPYAQYDATEESINKIQKKDIEKFHTRAYCGANGFATVVGDVDFKTAHETVSKFFKKLPKRKPLKLKKTKIPAIKKTQIIIVNRPGSVQTVFKLGTVAIERKNKDYVPLKVANYILGGSASSRLFLRVREKESHAYSIGSRVTQTVDKGTWYIYGSTSTDVTDKTLASTFEEIEKIGKEKAGPDELDEAKSYLTGSFALQIETTQQIAGLVTDMVVFGLPENYWDSYFDSISEVSLEAMEEKAKKYLDPERLLVVLVGDAGQLQKLLGAYENITIIEATEKEKEGE